MLLAKLAVGSLALYIALVSAAFTLQRRLIYAPDPRRTSPADVGLANVEELILKAPTGERLIAWYGAAKPCQPTILYLHGNGGSLELRSERIRRYMAQGRGMLMLAWRGYSGSEGSPSEAANVADAGLAYAALIAKGIKPADIFVYGESLGTGVAVQLAAGHPVGGVILDAPYTSLADVGARVYPFLPVRALLLDRYDTLSNIGKVRAPLLVLHGEKDLVIPVDMGRKVFAAANEPKELVTLPGAGHENHYLFGSYEAIAIWIDRTRAASRPRP
jgi:uncharacterized protein